MQRNTTVFIAQTFPKSHSSHPAVRLHASRQFSMEDTDTCNHFCDGFIEEALTRWSQIKNIEEFFKTTSRKLSDLRT